MNQADVDELARWLFENNTGFRLASWDKANYQCKNRWRVMAKKLLTKMPDVLIKYAKGAL